MGDKVYSASGQSRGKGGTEGPGGPKHRGHEMNLRWGDYCNRCKIKANSLCPHVHATGRERRRQAAKEKRRESRVDKLITPHPWKKDWR